MEKSDRVNYCSIAGVAVAAAWRNTLHHKQYYLHVRTHIPLPRLVPMYPEGSNSANGPVAWPAMFRSA